MIIKVPSISRIDTGGGSSFMRNFKKGMERLGYKIVDGDQDYDVLFIAGATLCDRDTVNHAVENRKHIILRVDNILEDSRNRNGGMPKMIEYAQKASVIVFQTEWAKKLLKPLIGDGAVIKNGVDTDIFYPRKEKKDWDNIRIFYSKYSRGEGKNFNVVQYFWREYNLEKQDDILVLVGRFAKELQQINNPFEFHNQEVFEFHSTITDPKRLADIYRSCDVALLPYSFDACSNTILEAQACGLPVLYENTGGTPEIIEFGHEINFENSPVDMVKLAIGDKRNYEFSDHKMIWGIDAMCQKYDGLIKLLGNEGEI